jgi:hypothetical protein
MISLLQKNKVSLNQHTRLGILISILLVLGSCATPTINESAYPYFHKKTELDPNTTHVLIATHNFGLPSKKYLRTHEAYIDEVVANQLSSQGYTVEPSSIFDTVWRNAIRLHGNVYSSDQASLNSNAFKRVLANVFKDIREQTNVDVIVFTDLLEQLVVFSGNNNRSAKWHGVSQSPKYVGSSTTSSESVDWHQTVPAVSLRVIAYSSEGELLFKSMGGLDLAKRINAKRGRFVRNPNLFSSSDDVNLGVRIALHPFIPFESETD